MAEHSFITKDSQKISVGTDIYYTGDMANAPGLFVVQTIEPCKWYGLSISLVETGEQSFGRKIRSLTPSSFDPGPGRRFETLEYRKQRRAEYLTDPEKKRERVRKLLASMKRSSQRRSREECMRNLGLVKVTVNGKVFWE